MGSQGYFVFFDVGKKPEFIFPNFLAVIVEVITKKALFRVFVGNAFLL